MGNALATSVFGAQVVEKMGGPMTPMTFNDTVCKDFGPDMWTCDIIYINI